MQELARPRRGHRPDDLAELPEAFANELDRAIGGARPHDGPHP